MVRLVIGSVVGGFVQWLVGFLFWGTPLSGLAFKVAPEAQNAAVQTMLAQALTPTGTGTYYVPWPDTPQGTVLHGRGPVALIHFNTAGFPVMDTGAIVGGLILSIVTIFLIGFALYAIADRVHDFTTRLRIVVLAAVATALYFTLGQPAVNQYLPWGYFVYQFISQVAGLIAGGLVLARWFLPRAASPVLP